METLPGYFSYQNQVESAVQVQALDSRYSIPSQRNWDELAWSLIYGSEQIVAGLALIALVPLLLVVAAAIFVLSGKGPFIAHKRVGYRNQDLWVYKFRTMWHRDANDRQPVKLVQYIVSNPNGIKTKSDCRITSKVAKLLRKYSIDELPQLYNVFAGEMTLIGPRPITEAELKEHYGETADFVVQVKPGISGLWQIAGRNNLTYPQRVQKDIEWVNRRTPALYMQTLIKTIPAVIGAKGAW